MVGLVGAVVLVVRPDYAQQPVHFLHMLPPLVVEVTVAAALCVRNPRRAALATLGRRGVVWFAVGVTVLLLGPMLDPALARVHTFADGSRQIGIWPDLGRSRRSRRCSAASNRSAWA